MKLQPNKEAYGKDMSIKCEIRIQKNDEPSFRDDSTPEFNKQTESTTVAPSNKECTDTKPTENAPLMRRFPTRARNKTKRLIEEC